MNTINIPKWAKIKKYRTMTKLKKKKAVEGIKKYQLEWMNEEINEFYEAIHKNNKDEILDEAIGLIRTAQQFSNSKRVLNKWMKVSNDVKKVFYNKKIFIKAFKKWKIKKTKKGQAQNVEAIHLIQFAHLFKK